MIMDDRKSAQTERRQNRNSSRSLFVAFLETFHRFPPRLIWLLLAQHPLLWFCQEPWINSFLTQNCPRRSMSIIKSCQTANFELKCISSIRMFFTEDAAKTRYFLYPLTAHDYCNRLLMGTSNSVIQPLQKIQNFAARLVLLAPRHQHGTGFPFENALSIKSLAWVSKR